MCRTILIWCLATGLLLATAADTPAQFQQGGVNTGSVGTSSFGASSFGTGGFGTGAFGSGGFGSSGFGSFGAGSGFGTSAFGSGFGGTGFGSTGIGGFGTQGFGQTTFGQGNQQFVGRDSGDMQAVFNSIGRSSNQFLQQLNRTMSAGRNRQASQQPENVQPPVRVQLQVAFDHVQPLPAVVAGKLRGRLEKILAEHRVNQPDVDIDGRTAVLRGTAASDSERLVLEKLVSLEPGVSEVVNLMTVVTDSATVPAAPETDN